MGEYMFRDLIIDPETPGLEGLIGKEVYASLIPARCLMIANGKCRRTYRCFLESIEPESSLPFCVKVIEADNPGDISYKSFPCIIPKRE